jgi:hypothetical protein
MYSKELSLFLQIRRDIDARFIVATEEVGRQRTQVIL